MPCVLGHYRVHVDGQFFPASTKRLPAVWVKSSSWPPQNASWPPAAARTAVLATLVLRNLIKT